MKRFWILVSDICLGFGFIGLIIAATGITEVLPDGSEVARLNNLACVFACIGIILVSSLVQKVLRGEP